MNTPDPFFALASDAGFSYHGSSCPWIPRRRVVVPWFPYLYESTPLLILQLALTLWMLTDASRRHVDTWWIWIILVIQPLGAWAYFCVYKLPDLNSGAWLANLFHRPPSVEELRHWAEQTPTLANRLELGERLAETGAYGEAVRYLEPVVAQEPEHCRAQVALARAYRGLGNPHKAVPLLKQVIARQPSWGNYDAYRQLIEVSQEAGDQTEVLTQCRALVRALPSLEHRHRLATQLLATGQKAEARTVLTEGLTEYRYLSGPSRRRDRRWVGKVQQLLKQVQA